MSADPHQDDVNDGIKYTEEGNAASYDGHLTQAQRRYMEQKEKIDVHRLAKTANKSHRDRIEDFNQYLANMSEHYDIPKVGPGWFYGVLLKVGQAGDAPSRFRIYIPMQCAASISASYILLVVIVFIFVADAYLSWLFWMYLTL